MIWSSVDTLGVGVEVGEDAVPQHGPDHGADIAGADGQAAVEDRPGLGGQHDVLRRSGAGAPGQPVADEVERTGLLGTGGTHQVDRVIHHVVAGRDLADELLDPARSRPVRTGLTSSCADWVVAWTIRRSSSRLG